MGNRFEIHAWLPNQRNGVGSERYGYVEVWRGDSRIRLLGAFISARLARKVALQVIYR